MIHTTVRTEIVLDMVSTIGCFCHFFRTSRDIQFGTFDEDTIGTERACKLAAIEAVAKCLWNIGLGQICYHQLNPRGCTNRRQRLAIVFNSNVAAETATNSHF